jgi:CubicO group peptidase (beta-lactamase class C family)
VVARCVEGCEAAATTLDNPFATHPACPSFTVKSTTPTGGYAYGWDVFHDSAGRRIVAKQGGQPGASTYFRIYPDDDVVVVVLTNRQGGGHSPHLLSADIGDLALGG